MRIERPGASSMSIDFSKMTVADLAQFKTAISTHPIIDKMVAGGFGTITEVTDLAMDMIARGELTVELDDDGLNYRILPTPMETKP